MRERKRVCWKDVYWPAVYLPPPADMETYNRLVELMNERKEHYPTMASC